MVPMMNLTPKDFGFKTADQLLRELCDGAVELLKVQWHRNKPATKKLLLTIKDERGTTKVMLPEGSHELYDSLKGVA